MMLFKAHLYFWCLNNVEQNLLTLVSTQNGLIPGGCEGKGGPPQNDHCLQKQTVTCNLIYLFKVLNGCSIVRKH